MRFPLDGSRAAVHAVNASEFAFRRAGLTLQDGLAGNGAVKCGLIFYALATPLHNRKHRAFNHFLAARRITGR
ncbi:MAG: hypothetical protein ACREC9_16565 [Methylocella sp.]